jgi:hypothetical protein
MYPYECLNIQELTPDVFPADKAYYSHNVGTLVLISVMLPLYDLESRDEHSLWSAIGWNKLISLLFGFYGCMDSNESVLHSSWLRYNRIWYAESARKFATGILFLTARKKFLLVQLNT